MVWDASTTPLFVAPLLSWISISATMSGLRRELTICVASAANFAAGLLAARFSTLNDATVSWPGAPTSAEVSGVMPPLVTLSGLVMSNLKLPKL